MFAIFSVLWCSDNGDRDARRLVSHRIATRTGGRYLGSGVGFEPLAIASLHVLKFDAKPGFLGLRSGLFLQGLGLVGSSMLVLLSFSIHMDTAVSKTEEMNGARNVRRTPAHAARRSRRLVKKCLPSIVNCDPRSDSCSSLLT